MEVTDLKLSEAYQEIDVNHIIANRLYKFTSSGVVEIQEYLDGEWSQVHNSNDAVKSVDIFTTSGKIRAKGRGFLSWKLSDGNFNACLLYTSPSPRD